MKTLMIYGAAGYTGRMAAGHAKAAGLNVIVAGRDAAELAKLALDLGVDHRVFALDDDATVDAALSGVSVLLNCAGPYIRTAEPLMRAAAAEAQAAAGDCPRPARDRAVQDADQCRRGRGTGTDSGNPRRNGRGGIRRFARRPRRLPRKTPGPLRFAGGVIAPPTARGFRGAPPGPYGVKSPLSVPSLPFVFP